MLSVAPERRPNIEDIQQHPWVKSPEGNIPSEPFPDAVFVKELFSYGFALRRSYTPYIKENIMRS